IGKEVAKERVAGRKQLARRCTRASAALGAASDVGAFHPGDHTGERAEIAPLLALVNVLARQFDRNAMAIRMMEERATIALVAGETVEHIDHHALDLVVNYGLPQAIHTGAIQVLATFHLAVDVRLRHLPAQCGRTCAAEALLLREAGGVALPRRAHPAIDGGARHGG